MNWAVGCELRVERGETRAIKVQARRLLRRPPADRAEALSVRIALSAECRFNEEAGA
jgi:hypothetical protein